MVGASSPELSIIVCTRNRADVLGTCLSSIHDVADDDDVEVVVIDNGSTDETPLVLARFAQSVGTITEVEPEPGLARARNRGLRLATGRVVAFLDDDVTLLPSWGTALRRFFAETDMVGLAGRITLAFPHHRPRWLHPDLDTWYAAVDLGERRRPLTASEVPFGANMALLRSVAEEVGGFDESLGYRDKRLGGSEETDLFERVRTAGHRLGYDPDVAVLHHIGAERLSPRWVLRRNLAQGRTNAALEHRRAGERELAARSRQAAARALMRGWGSQARAVATSSSPRRAEVVRALADRAKKLGFALEAARRSRRRDQSNRR